MLQGESTNGGCSMEQAKGMRELSEWCVAFLGMAPRGRLQNVTCEQRLKEVRRLPIWIYRTEVSCCEDTQNQDSKAGICLIYVRNSKEAGILGRMPTGGSRISDLRVMQAIVSTDAVLLGEVGATEDPWAEAWCDHLMEGGRGKGRPRRETMVAQGSLAAGRGTVWAVGNGWQRVSQQDFLFNRLLNVRVRNNSCKPTPGHVSGEN